MTSSRTLARFALVGAVVAAVYVLLFAALRELGLAREPANALAFLAAVSVQYLGQAGFTFGARWRDGKQAMRFAAMVALGLATSALVTGVFGPALGWPDLMSAIVVTVVLPVQNFIIMSRWVFPRGREQETAG